MYVRGRFVFHPSSVNIMIWICFQNEEECLMQDKILQRLH